MNRSLGSSVALCLTFCLAFAPCMNAAPPTSAVPLGTVRTVATSDAVTSAASVSAVMLLNKSREGTLDASDVQGAIVALSTLFAHMQETGLNDQIQLNILSHEDAILNSGPTEEQIQGLYSKVNSSGGKVSLNEFRNSLLTAQAGRQQFLSKIKKVGLWAVEKEQITELQKIQVTLKADTSMRSPAALSSLYSFNAHSFKTASFDRSSTSSAHLRRAYCEAAALSAECALLAIFSPPPLDAVMAAMAAVYGIEAAFC
jgi:hypothetical protein